MKITFYGVCGSSPSITKDLPNIKHTACVAVETDACLIIFDAGSGIINLGNALTDVAKPILLFFSHFHYDHIIGLPYFSPLYDPNHNITIIYPDIKKIKSILPKIFDSDFFPISYSQLPKAIPIKTPDYCSNFNVSVTSYNLKHPGGCYGYRLNHDNKALIYATDNQLDSKNITPFITSFKDCDVLIHDCYFFNESQENLKTWGHTFLPDLVSLCFKANIHHLIPFHFKPDISKEYLSNMITYLDNHIAKNKSSLRYTFPYDDLFLRL